MKRISLYLFVFSMMLPLLAQAGWKDYLNELKDSVKQKTSSGKNAPLSDDMIVKGLKQALNQGVEKSVKQLGRKNGFLKDASVKIPMPKTLKKVDRGLRKVGKDDVADKFINTMNHAAEQAVPGTVDILLNAVKAMSIRDAVNILKGEDDAATQYFRKRSLPHLRKVIKPIVKRATNSVGVTESYKKMIRKAGFLAKFIDKDSLNIDQYITDKAIDGLFIKIAREEKRIRQDPLARTTDILRQVFAD